MRSAVPVRQRVAPPGAIGAGLIGAEVSETMGFAVLLAGLAGSSFLGRSKPRSWIDTDDDQGSPGPALPVA